MRLLETLSITHAVKATHWDSFRFGSFREQFTIRFQGGSSFWTDVVLHGRKPEWGRVRLDFNPNKIAHLCSNCAGALCGEYASHAPQNPAV